MTDLSTRVAVAALGVVALVACGGDAKKPVAAGNPASGATPGATASGASPGASVVPGQPGTNATPGGSASTAPTAPGASASTPPKPGTSPSAASSPTHAELDATLAKTCVKPGESQTLTLNARPDMKVIFNTLYKDGQDGSTHGGRVDPGAKARTDATGRYVNTFTVSATAPQGEAALTVAAVDQQGTGSRRLTFQVSLTC